MKRACYLESENENGEKSYQVCHLKALRKDGSVETEPIEGMETINSLIDLFIKANKSGYGIVGSLEEVEKKNRLKYSEEMNSYNIMKVDDL